MRKTGISYQQLFLFICCSICMMFPAMKVNGMVKPGPIAKISTSDELEDWYNHGSDSCPDAILTKDIVINHAVTLSRIEKTLCLAMMPGQIRITSGGILMIDSPDLALAGAERMFVVEGTGKLILRRGDVEPTTVTDPIRIILKDKSTFVLESGFTGLSADMIEDLRHNSPSIDDSCLPDDKMEESAAPDQTQEPDSTTNLGGSGNTVQPGLSLVKLISVSASGDTRIRLDFTHVPPDTEAVYLFCSSDGRNWEKAYYKEVGLDEEGATVLVKKYNFMMISDVVEKKFIHYKYHTDYQPIYVRTQIVTLSQTYTTNHKKLEIPKNVRPGISASYDHSEDGSLGGNRGGVQSSQGTQNPGSREIQPVQADGGETSYHMRNGRTGSLSTQYGAGYGDTQSADSSTVSSIEASEFSSREKSSKEQSDINSKEIIADSPKVIASGEKVEEVIQVDSGAWAVDGKIQEPQTQYPGFFRASVLTGALLGCGLVFKKWIKKI